MASEVKTNKISPAVGTDVTLGDASDTFTIPASATLDINGTIDLTGATKTGFPSITTASQWRLTADFTGNADPIASNLEVVDTAGYGSLGSAMTESSGIFTFPSTGYWLIFANGMFAYTGASDYNQIYIDTTVNNSTYVAAAFSSVLLRPAVGLMDSSAVAIHQFDVTDTTLCKVRFRIVLQVVAATVKGDSSVSETSFTFMKLGDT